jgi:hypothetical protein
VNSRGTSTNGYNKRGFVVAALPWLAPRLISGVYTRRDIQATSGVDAVVFLEARATVDQLLADSVVCDHCL